MTNHEFIVILYILFQIVALLYMAYKLWNTDYTKQALNLITWMSSVSLIVVTAAAIVR